ncbi:MAG: DUF6242 domain-containing protein [Tannerella sp.]|jgi:hypothetical protein|nr:DUF6242 domain-containing protein [Tannerella sp.]
MKKNKCLLWIAGCIVTALSSCLGDVTVSEWNLSNCQIQSFALSNDSIEGLSDVVFTIDQVNGLIFNRDSMPYGTVIDRKVVCTVEFVLGYVSSIKIYPEATQESIEWNGSDSIDFSAPVRFIIESYDKKEIKTYLASLNVHQQKPDSVEWVRCSSPLPEGKTIRDQKVIAWNGDYLMYVKESSGIVLYRSPVTDAVTWSPESPEGFPQSGVLSQLTEYNGKLYLPSSDGVLYQSSDGLTWDIVGSTPSIVALLGTLPAAEQVERSAILTAIVKDDNVLSFAAMDTAMQWQTGVETPSVFPVTGFGSASYVSGYYPHRMVVAGKDRNGQLSNMAWDTMNGLSWVSLTEEGTSYFEQKEGVMVASYDDCFYMIGGINASNEATRDMYVSYDKGISWVLTDSAKILPETFQPRGYASFLVDEAQYMLLFGGKEKTNTDMLNELWRGRINRLGFKE